MIKEIVQFTKALPEETFSKNLELKDGLYLFLKYENDELIIDQDRYLLVNNKTEKTPLYQEFLELYSCSNMITNKSMNSNEKIFIDVGSPFAISISGKGLKPDETKSETPANRRKKQIDAVNAYFKRVSEEVDFEPEEFAQQKKWNNDFQYFVKSKMFDFFDTNGKIEKKGEKWELDFEFGNIQQKIKDTFSFYFFMDAPKLSDYNLFYDKYIESGVFLYPLKKNETHGISNDITVGNVTKKPFMRHKTASFEVNYKVSGEDAKSIYKFFQLKKSAIKVLPNPCPIFVQQDELNEDIVHFQIDDKTLTFPKLIQQLSLKHNADLQNYYLIYFQGGLKGSQIIDVDFVTHFKYKLDNITLTEVFWLGGKFATSSVKTVFELQNTVFNCIFNGKLCPKEGWIRYFDDIEPDLKYAFTDAICNLMLQYRKSIYDYIYKSRHQSITCAMFDRMMTVSILEDIRIDEYRNENHSRGYQIKEKLNLWFSLYTHFSQNQNRENMASRIPELVEKMKQVANGDSISFSEDPAEFAFGAGQIVYFLLTKSAASNKSYAMLEPFLQKTKVSQLQDAISNSIAMYKHEIDVSKG
jgi:CRISPR-associated protein Csh1